MTYHSKVFDLARPVDTAARVDELDSNLARLPEDTKLALAALKASLEKGGNE